MASSTRDALVDAAVQLLDEGGPEAVTLREVGHRAGVSHNAPYKHFTGKEALLAAVAARELRRRPSPISLSGSTPRMASPCPSRRCAARWSSSTSGRIPVSTASGAFLTSRPGARTT